MTNADLANSQVVADNELNDINVTKYKAAAEIAKNALAAVLDAAVPDAKIIDLNKIGDDFIAEAASKLYTKGKGKVEKNAKGIAFPTCVNIGTAICHLHPFDDDPEASLVLEKGSLARISLAVHIDGYTAQIAHTIVIGATEESPATGRQADVLMAGHIACEAVLRTLKDGNVTTQVTDAVKAVMVDFKCVHVEGLVSGQVQKNKLEIGKQIIFAPADGQQRKEDKEVHTFATGEVYSIDIVVSSGDGKPRGTPETKVNVFKREPDVSYSLKLKASRARLTEITQKFGSMAFGIESLDEPKKARMGLSECITHNLIIPYGVLHEKPGVSVANFVFTVMLLPSGPLKITSYPWNPATISCDKKVENESIVELLKTSVRPKKAKK